MRKRILYLAPVASDRKRLQPFLQDEYEVASAGDASSALRHLKDFGPDLVLLDCLTERIDAVAFCHALRDAPAGHLIYLLLMIPDNDPERRLQAYAAGADDCFGGGLAPAEIAAKVRACFRRSGALMELAHAHATDQIENAELDRRIRERTAQIVETRDVAVFALAKLAESRDPETGEHLERMRGYAQLLARHLGDQGPYVEQIDALFLDDLYRSSPLHDIGKVGIPDVILLKPDRLTLHEFRLMQRHTLIGAEALESAAAHSTSGSFLTMAAAIARSHHERFDGSGYPDGLVGQGIPLAARIAAVADVYDALTSVRVYKDAFDARVARAMILEQEGRHFDPAVLDAFRACEARFLEVPGRGHRTEQRLAETNASNDARR